MYIHMSLHFRLGPGLVDSPGSQGTSLHCVSWLRLQVRYIHNIFNTFWCRDVYYIQYIYNII